MPKRGFEHIFLLLFGLSIIALFSFSWLFKFIIQPISFRYDFSQINSYENAVSLEPIGKNFETLKIVQTDPQGSEVRTRTHLLSHRLLLEKIANISVEAFGRSWTYNDICFKPRSALLDLDFGGLSYMEEFVKIVRGYLPCYLVTPINSFWDRLSLNQIIRRNDLETLEQLEVYLELEFDLPLLQECGKSSFNKNALKCFDSIKSLISSRMRNESDIVTKEDFGRFQLSSKRMQYLSDEQLECLDPSDKCHLDQFVRPLNFYNVCDAMSQISRKSGRFPLTMYMLFRGDRRKGSMFPILDCQNEDDVRIFFEKLLELESPLARSGISLPRFPNYTKTLSRGSSAIHGEWNNEELLVGGNISEKVSEGEPRIEVADYFRLQISLMKAETLVRIMLSTGEERRDFWTKENAQFILDEWTNALRATIESFNRDSASVFLFETKSEDPVLVENSTAARLIFIFCSLLMLFYYLVRTEISIDFFFWTFLRFLTCLAVYFAVSLSGGNLTQLSPSSLVCAGLVFVTNLSLSFMVLSRAEKPIEYPDFAKMTSLAVAAMLTLIPSIDLFEFNTISPLFTSSVFFLFASLLFGAYFQSCCTWFSFDGLWESIKKIGESRLEFLLETTRSQRRKRRTRRKHGLPTIEEISLKSFQTSMNSHEPEDFTDISTPSFSTMASFHCPLPKVLRKFFTSTYWATLAIAQLSYIYCCHGKWKAAPLLAAAALLLSSVAILLFVDPLDPENRELLASLKYGNEELTVEVDVLKFKDVIDIEETQLSLHRFLKEIELLSSLFPVSVWPRSFVEYVTEMQPNFDKEFSASSYSECVTHLKNSSQSQMYAMACRVYCISRGDDCKGEGNFDGFFKDDSIVHGKLFYAALVGWHHEKIDDAQVWSSRIQPRPPSPHVFFARPASKKDQNHTEPSLQSFQLVFELRRTSWSYLQTAVKEVENICSKHLRSQHLSFRLKGTLFSAAQREIYIQKLRLTLVPWIFFAGFASVFQLGFKTSSMLSTISTLLYIEFSAISRFFDVKYQNALFLITLLVSLTAYSMGFSLCIAVSPQKVRRLSPLKIYNLVSKYWVALMIVFTTLYPLNYYYQLGLSSLISVLLCGLLSSAFGALIVLPQLIRLVGINIESADKRACERYLEARVFHRKQKLKEMNRQKRIVWDRCSGLEAPPNTLSTSRTRSSSRQTGPSTSSEFSSVLSTEGSNDFEVEDEDEEVRETIRQLRERWTRQKTDNSFLENVTHADEALQNLKLERAERNKRKEELIATIEEKTKREEKEEEMGIEEAAEPQAVHPLAQHFPPNFTWEMIEFITNPNNRGGIPWSPFEPSPAQELILAPNVEAVIMEEDDDEPDEQAREEQESDESGEEVNHVNDDRGGDGDAESSDDPSNDEWLEEDEGFGADVV